MQPFMVRINRRTVQHSVDHVFEADSLKHLLALLLRLSAESLQKLLVAVFKDVGILPRAEESLRDTKRFHDRT